MRQLSKAYALLQGPFLCADRRIPTKPMAELGEPVAMLGVAPLCASADVSGGREAAFDRSFWTSKGIFAQRWGLNVGFNGALF
jgi:hypothetical protein